MDRKMGYYVVIKYCEQIFVDVGQSSRYVNWKLRLENSTF